MGPETHMHAAGGDASESHELPRAFAASGIALNSTLVEMLDEHYSHRTERRGCGYTQATRHLAVLVNQPPDRVHESIAKLFPQWHRERRNSLPEGETPGAWLQREIRSIADSVEREESKLLAELMIDLVQPTASSAPALPPYFDEIKVGTCPLAEKYFLEITDRVVRRKGRVNVLVSDEGEPLLIEKINLGDSHSCISVTTLVINGVRLPPGCLFGVHYEEDDVALRPNRALPGSIIPIRRCAGFRFLRLTTLAVSPKNRARAFTTHFKAQVDAPLYKPAEATIDELRTVTREQL